MTPIRYLDVCSGYSAITLAWDGLPFKCVGYSEIEPFPRAILEQRHGAVAVDWDHRFAPGSNVSPLFGDFTQIEDHHVGPVDVLAGGTPCQDNSVGFAAGSGRSGDGLDGDRGRLAFDFADLAHRVGAVAFVWENVPNILGARLAPHFLRLVRRFVELGYGIAWRVLDDRWTGGLRDQPRPRLFVVGYRDNAAAARAILFEREGACWDRPSKEATSPVLTARGGMALDDRTPCVLDAHGPRIATPLEWERAMGVPDGFTAITYRGKPAADGPRYKVLGNSQAVNCMRWIGHGLADVIAAQRSVVDHAA